MNEMTELSDLSQVRQIKKWFETAVPYPTEHNIHAQLGVHLEEVAEMLSALRDAGAKFPVREQLGFVVDVLNFIQKQINAYTNGAEIVVQDLDRVEILDALCDQIVTAIGCAHMLGMDIEGALAEVARSNDSKFDEDGQPIFNPQKKIMKGPNYFAPDLTKFV